jgi:hypothetical protein
MKKPAVKIKEADLLSYASKRLEHRGVLWWRMPIGGVAHMVGPKMIFKKSPIKGFPDLCGLTSKGEFFAIELKSATGKLSPEQKEWLTKLYNNRARVEVLKSFQEIDDFIASL